MITPAIVVLNVLRDISMDVMTMFYYYFFAKIFYREYAPIQMSRVWISVGLNILVHLPVRFILYDQNVLNVIIVYSSLIVMCWIMWQPTHYSSFFINFVIALIIYTFYEFTLSYLFQLSYPPDVAYFLNASGVPDAHYFRPKSLLVFYLYAFGMMAALIALCYGAYKLYHLARRRFTINPRVLRIIMFFLVLFGLSAVVAQYMYEYIITGTHFTESWEVFAAFFLAVALLFTYVIQDLNQLRLQQKNQTLAGENVAYQRIIDSTREFRHNLANMIYGMEGVLLTGDMDQIRQYYDEMEKRCALINNENMMAINRITNPSVVALLLRKMEAAQEQKIPFYLSADPNFRITGISDVSACEVIGNMIDNALEAAALSNVPRVNLTLRSESNYCELSLENTCAADADLSFLTGNFASTKVGHAGKGLKSIHSALKNRQSVLFNQFQQGRYIVSAISFYRDIL